MVNKKINQEPIVKEVVVEKQAVVNFSLIGKTIGTTVIVGGEKIKINGKEYFKLRLANDTETIVSEKDLIEQGIK